jgi:hypothetical protein
MKQRRQIGGKKHLIIRIVELNDPHNKKPLRFIVDDAEWLDTQ